MIGKDLPDKDHVIRFVRSTLIDNGVVCGGAFCLRKIEMGLKVNWLEVFGGNKIYQMNRARESCNPTLSKSGKFAELNVGITKRYVNRNSIQSFAATYSKIFSIQQLKHTDLFRIGKNRIQSFSLAFQFFSNVVHDEQFDCPDNI